MGLGGKVVVVDGEDLGVGVGALDGLPVPSGLLEEEDGTCWLCGASNSATGLRAELVEVVTGRGWAGFVGVETGSWFLDGWGGCGERKYFSLRDGQCGLWWGLAG